jgi:hypothetical protein
MHPTVNNQARPSAVWELESPWRGLARSMLGLLGREASVAPNSLAPIGVSRDIENRPTWRLSDLRQQPPVRGNLPPTETDPAMPSTTVALASRAEFLKRCCWITPRR